MQLTKRQEKIIVEQTGLSLVALVDKIIEVAGDLSNDQKPSAEMREAQWQLEYLRDKLLDRLGKSPVLELEQACDSASRITGDGIIGLRMWEVIDTLEAQLAESQP